MSCVGHAGHAESLFSQFGQLGGMVWLRAAGRAVARPAPLRRASIYAKVIRSSAFISKGVAVSQNFSGFITLPRILRDMT